jgi:hypothetical protein
MDTKNERRTRRNIVVFAVMVTCLAALAGIIEQLTISPDAEPGSAGLGQGLWIIAPLAVMLLLRFFGGDGWSGAGLRPNFKGNGFWWMVSILIFPVTITVTLVLGGLFNRLSLNVDMLRGVSAGTFLTMLISMLVKNVFEEFAWRGYLAPKMYSLNINIWLSHSIVGLIWGVWHLPFVFVFWTYLTPDMLWYFVPLLLIGCISHSVVYGEIRLATDSAIPAWIMHTIGNTFGSVLLMNGIVQFHSGQELFLSPGTEGIISIIMMFAIGYWLHKRRVKAV